MLINKRDGDGFKTNPQKAKFYQITVTVHPWEQCNKLDPKEQDKPRFEIARQSWIQAQQGGMNVESLVQL